MKIAWLANYDVDLLSPPLLIAERGYGHASSWITNLSNALSSIDSIELHVITLNPYIPFTQEFKKDGLFFHVIKSGIPFLARGFPYYFPFDILTVYWLERRKIAQIIRSLSPDLLHVHGTESAYGVAACGIKIPNLVSIQGIMTALSEVSKSFCYRLQSILEKKVIHTTSYFGCRTDFDRKFVTELNKNATIFQLNEAINPVYFLNKWEDNGRHDIVFVGSIIKRKGVEELIEALAIILNKFPDSTLHLIGGHATPSYLSFLQEKCYELNIEKNVVFMGVKNALQIRNILLNSDVFVLPSHNENSPNSLAEAMVLGMPVVATQVGGIPSMVEHGVNGILCKSRNAHALAAAISGLFSDRGYMMELGNNSRQLAIQRHNPEQVAEKTISAYNTILNLETGSGGSALR
jgi:glycosyltransferase involved in cell wall biosynthesis